MNTSQNSNTIIPSKIELIKVAQENYPSWYREDLNRGTNCTWEMMNYIKDGKNIRLFVKKSFLRWDIKKFEDEYKLIKEKLKNIVPNQWFVSVWWNIFAFCSPIGIKIDVLSDQNKEYLIETIKSEPKLLKQIIFFIRVFENFLQEWLTLDLHGNENLVISDDNKLYYLDSFLVFHQSQNVQEWSMRNLNYLKELVEKAK